VKQINLLLSPIQSSNEDFSNSISNAFTKEMVVSRSFLMAMQFNMNKVVYSKNLSVLLSEIVKEHFSGRISMTTRLPVLILKSIVNFAGSVSQDEI
jgi:hypothetical protein